jgi:hypothetical protein
MKKLLLAICFIFTLNVQAEEICYGLSLTDPSLIKIAGTEFDFYDNPSELFEYCDVGDILYLRGFDWQDSLGRNIATYCDLSETHMVTGISGRGTTLVCRLVKVREIKQ